MRLMPAPLGMHLLLGHSIPHGLHTPAVADRIRAGREWLVQITGEDFGYDPIRWHEHLRTTGEGGYRRSKDGRPVPRQITSALNDTAWRQAVATLTAALVE